MGESEAPAKKKRKREKYCDAECDSYNKSSPIPGTQTHPHSPVLWICINVYKHIHNNKTFSLQAPMPNSDTISNPKEKLAFTKGISLGIPTTL